MTLLTFLVFILAYPYRYIFLQFLITLPVPLHLSSIVFILRKTEKSLSESGAFLIIVMVIAVLTKCKKYKSINLKLI
jgi:hypothetical protein